ncbi:MAG: hypothetical protein JW881_04015 [Spirochaetales bacterium]|nr:hypothetical protein [Spirochaetales bacterium]
MLIHPISKIEENEKQDIKCQVLQLLTLCMKSDKSRFHEYYKALKTKLIYMLARGWITSDAYQYILKKAHLSLI